MNKPNPLKLNKLQLKTLAIAQVLAQNPFGTLKDEETGNVALLSVPHAHGDHAHVGPYVVSSRDLSGFENDAVWVALARKKLTLGSPSDGELILLKAGVDYVTGLEKMFDHSDH